jgi:hypothetical protein
MALDIRVADIQAVYYAWRSLASARTVTNGGHGCGLRSPAWLGWRTSPVRVTVASRRHKCPASFTARTQTIRLAQIPLSTPWAEAPRLA